MVTFEICQLLATPGPFKYFDQNQSFLNEGVTGLRCDLGVLGGQITRLYDGTIFGVGAMHLRGQHRCSLGCSRYPSLDWRLAVFWAIRCRFLTFFDISKSSQIFRAMGIWNFDPKFGMKVSIYLTWNKKKSEFFSLVGLQAMAVRVIGHFRAIT